MQVPYVLRITGYVLVPDGDSDWNALRVSSWLQSMEVGDSIQGRVARCV